MQFGDFEAAMLAAAADEAAAAAAVASTNIQNKSTRTDST
jgi:hypothetical protein